MEYYLKRGEESHGPYCLADLQLMAAQGKLLAEDLVWGIRIRKWLPASTVVPHFSESAAIHGAGQPTVQISGSLPPDLHWAVVLLLDVLTCGIAGLVWSFVQARFVRRIDPESNATLLLTLQVLSWFVVVLAVAITRRGSGLVSIQALVSIWLFVATFLSMRGSLNRYYTSAEPIGLQLSTPMTLIFHVLYLQYQLTRITRWKKTGVLD